MSALGGISAPLRRLTFRILRPLPTGVGAELRRGDTGEPLTAGRLRAVVPSRLAKGAQRSPEIALVHAPLYHASATVSNKGLDTVAMMCYNSLATLDKERAMRTMFKVKVGGEWVGTRMPAAGLLTRRYRYTEDCCHCDGERSGFARNDDTRGQVCPVCDVKLDEMLGE